MREKAWQIVLYTSLVGWVLLFGAEIALAVANDSPLPQPAFGLLLAALLVATILSGIFAIVDRALLRHRAVVLQMVAAAERRYARPVAWTSADWPTAPLPAIDIGRAPVAEGDQLPSPRVLAAVRKLARRVAEQEGLEDE